MRTRATDQQQEKRYGGCRHPEDVHARLPLDDEEVEADRGVIWAISTTRTMKMPNQSGSMPACSTIGMMTEVVSTTTEMPSRKAAEHDKENGQCAEQGIGRQSAGCRSRRRAFAECR